MEHIFGLLLAFSIPLFTFPIISFDQVLYKGIPTSIFPASLSAGDLVLIISALLSLFIRRSFLRIKKPYALHVITLLLFVVISFKDFPVIESSFIYLFRISLFLILFSVLEIRKSFLKIILIISASLAILQFLFQQSVGLPLEPVTNVYMKGVAKVFYDGVTILRPSGFFSHPNILAGIFLVGVIGLIKFKNLSFSELVFIGIGALGILLTGSRSGLFGLLLLLGILTLTNWRDWRFQKTLLLVFLFFIPFIPYYLFRSSHTDLEGPIRYRTEVIVNSLQNASARQILIGSGLKKILNSDPSSSEAFYLSQPPHNAFVVYFLALGIVPGFLLLYFLWRTSRPLSIPKIIIFLPILFLDYFILSPSISFLFLPLIFFTIKKDVPRETP